MSSLKNKLSLKTFGLVYPFEYDFKCYYNTIAPGHLNTNSKATRDKTSRYIIFYNKSTFYYPLFSHFLYIFFLNLDRF